MVPNTILFGTVVGVLSSATQSVGLTLQRKSHILEDLRPHDYRPPHHRTLWRWGFLLFLVANLLGSSIQITTLPLIILSPLQAVGLVFNSVCSAIILEEGFTVLSVAGTILVGLGALLIAFFGSIQEPNHTLKELLELMARPPFVTWIIISISGVLVILVWISTVKLLHTQSMSQRVQQIPRSLRPMFDVPVKKFSFVRGCLYGIVSGTLSAHSLLLAKSTVELLLNAFFKSNYEAFQNVKSWIIISSFFVLAITQLAFLNRGLQFVSTSVLYPLVFCVYNITNIVNGLVFYNQLHVLFKIQIFMIILGTALVLIGVFALSWRLEDAHDEDSTQMLKDSIDFHERSPLLGNDRQSLLDDDDEETTGYISFGTPKSINARDDDHDSTSTPSKRTSQIADASSSPLSQFKGFGVLVDAANTTMSSARSKRRSRRVLSYEQNELLAQLNQMPDL